MTKPQVRGWCGSVFEQRRVGANHLKLDSSKAVILVVFCVTAVIASHGQTFNTLVTFQGANGTSPFFESLVQGADGDLYGTTEAGGTTGYGTVFELTSAGKLTTLYNFCSQSNCTDGGDAIGGLLLATNGNFYGTTMAGGAFGAGTVFEITPAGKPTTLYSFAGPDGEAPYGTLVQASNGNFYGTTFRGGANGDGTVFEITAAGKLTTLHNFNGTDGSQIYAGLVQAGNGTFYGTTNFSGNNFGTVFEITPAGKFTTLYTFSGGDGSSPFAPLIQASNGNLYGTTAGGGTTAYGTVFEITPAGTLTTLYSFCPRAGCLDGAVPIAPLVQGSDGSFYGATSQGGAYSGTLCPNGCGTLFKISAAGRLTTLYSFCHLAGCPDGDLVYGGLAQATNGSFYGVSLDGGDLTCGGNHQGCGTVFSLAVGLRPFVKTLPTSAKVGANVVILGTNLTMTTGVSFNGTAASFTVESSSEITAIVPAGATSGRVTVTTPSGVLNSNRPFRVIP